MQALVPVGEIQLTDVAADLLLELSWLAKLIRKVPASA